MIHDAGWNDVRVWIKYTNKGDAYIGYTPIFLNYIPKKADEWCWQPNSEFSKSDLGICAPDLRELVKYGTGVNNVHEVTDPEDKKNVVKLFGIDRDYVSVIQYANILAHWGAVEWDKLQEKVAIYGDLRQRYVKSILVDMFGVHAYGQEWDNHKLFHELIYTSKYMQNYGLPEGWENEIIIRIKGDVVELSTPCEQLYEVDIQYASSYSDSLNYIYKNKFYKDGLPLYPETKGIAEANTNRSIIHSILGNNMLHHERETFIAKIRQWFDMKNQPDTSSIQSTNSGENILILL